MNSVYRFYVPYAANSVCANVKSILLNIFLVIAYIFTFRQNATAIDPLCVVCMIWCGHCGQLAREWWHYHFGRQHENSMYRCSLWHVCLVVRQQLENEKNKIQNHIYVYGRPLISRIISVVFRFCSPRNEKCCTSKGIVTVHSQFALYWGPFVTFSRIFRSVRMMTAITNSSKKKRIIEIKQRQRKKTNWEEKKYVYNIYWK